MVERILDQNKTFRRILDDLNNLYRHTTLLKVNEVGDSWIVAVKGAACCTLAKRFAMELQLQSKLPIRIGVHYGTFTIVKLNRHDANGFLPMQYECFGLDRDVLETVKTLEQTSSVGGVHCSDAVQVHLVGEVDRINASEKNDSCRPSVVPIVLEGYVMFVVVNGGRVQLLEEMCNWGRSNRVNTDVKVVSLEDEGRVWSMFGHSVESVRDWLAWAALALDMTRTKISVVWTTRVWQIHDVSADPYQRSVRYVSHAQNVAARMIHRPGGWGNVMSDLRCTLTDVVPTCDDTVATACSDLKGLGTTTTIHSAKLAGPPPIFTREVMTQAQCACAMS